MSAILYTGNLPTTPAAPMGTATRGAMLLLIGALLGYGVGVGDKEFAPGMSVSSTAAVVEDWHGNVMRSNWSN